MIEGEQRYSYTQSLISGLNVGGRLTQSPGRFTPINDSVHYGEWAQGRSGRVRKTFHPPRFDPRILQPTESGYTDYANPARIETKRTLKIVEQGNKELERMWKQSVSINYGCLSPRTK